MMQTPLFDFAGVALADDKASTDTSNDWYTPPPVRPGQHGRVHRIGRVLLSEALCIVRKGGGFMTPEQARELFASVVDTAPHSVLRRTALQWLIESVLIDTIYNGIQHNDEYAMKIGQRLQQALAAVEREYTGPVDAA